MANLKATQKDIARAFALYQQSWDITESINDVKTKAATLRQMANLQARQGDIAGAFPLFQQCLKIHESINDVQGKAATLASMAYWEGQRGNKTEQLELNLQAAQLFAQVRAYLDLRQVLRNLGLSAETNGIIYLAQAVWLCLRIEVPLHDAVNTLAAMYYKLPQGDEMQGLLGATAMFFCQMRGGEHPQLKELEDHSWVVWEEGGKYPNLIIELLSPSTAATDKGLKKQIYQDIFRTPEYFWFDTQSLEFAGFILLGGTYQPIEPNPQGLLWSQQLNLHLGVHEGKLRYFTPEAQLMLTPEEYGVQEKERAERLAAKLRELNIDPESL